MSDWQVSSAELTAQRRQRLRSTLAASAADVLLLTAPENVLYATGYRSMGGNVFRTHQMAAVLTEDDCWLVAPAADAAPAVDAGLPLDRVVPFGRFYFESAPRSEISDYADRWQTLPHGVAEVARRLGPSVRWAADEVSSAAAAVLDDPADGAEVVWAARRIKLAGEVERLRQAARLAETGIDVALAGAAAGVTETELAASIAGVMVAGGAEPRFVVATTGPRTALADTFPTDRSWRPGELARFDVGCVLDGYWSDMARSAVLGEPSGLQAERYRALLAGEQQQLQLAKPGVRAVELFDVAVATVQAHSISPYRRQHCGHCIGASIYEPPIVAPGADGVLEPGMTLCLETPFYEVGWGGLMVEDTVHVTDAGIELLTSTDRGLRVVAG
ncbi:MAG: M24 family metallopeptidase [Mycobacteriales bacterium]